MLRQDIITWSFTACHQPWHSID